MKYIRWSMIFVMVFASTVYAKNDVWIEDVYHPRSEPPELYIVTFVTRYDREVQKYRMYCPTGMVREITGGSWQKARKAYREDRLKYGSKRVVRKVFDEICE